MGFQGDYAPGRRPVWGLREPGEHHHPAQRPQPRGVGVQRLRQADGGLLPGGCPRERPQRVRRHPGHHVLPALGEAGATIVAAARSTTSFLPPLGNGKAKVLTLNLRNRLIFRAADEADAVQAADFIGKKTVVKRSWGHSAGKQNVNYSETEEHKIKPRQLRTLCDHECVVVHCERGFRRVTLPPLEFDGTVSHRFSQWKRSLWR